MAAPTASFRSRTWPMRCSAKSRTSTTRTKRLGSCASLTARSWPMRVRRWKRGGRRSGPGSGLAEARAPLEDVVATVGPEFEVGEIGDEVDTLGGYVMTRAGRLPTRGQVVPGPGEFEIEVLDSDPRRLKRVRITRGSSGRTERNARRRDAAPTIVPPDAEAPSGKGLP